MKVFPIDEIDYDKYINSKINSRVFSLDVIQNLIAENQNLEWQLLGLSFEKRPIKMGVLGKGSIKIMMWTQMHGNEPTATAAIFDLLNFFNSSDFKFINDIIKSCTLYFIPVVNPDGLEKFTRRNAQGIDINRDFLAQQSPEGQILKDIQQQLKPDFAFNLHDQDIWYSMPKSKKTVAIALLAPSANADKINNWNREQAMKLSSCIFDTLQQLKPAQIARFRDEYEPRSFGDNFQMAGSATILIESGYVNADEEKQEIRKLNFFAILSALHGICYQYYQEKDLINYLMIPEEKKELFHLILRNCSVLKNSQIYMLDIGLAYEEILMQNRELEKIWKLTEAGDLSTNAGLEEIEADNYFIEGNLLFDKPANLTIIDQHQKIIIKFEDGLRI